MMMLSICRVEDCGARVLPDNIIMSQEGGDLFSSVSSLFLLGLTCIQFYKGYIIYPNLTMT